MIGQNFSNFIEFFKSKYEIYRGKAALLEASAKVPPISHVGNDSVNIEVRVWVCNYRERRNNITLNESFVFSPENRQGWSKWLYGLPSNQVVNLKYVPSKQPDFRYLGKTYSRSGNAVYMGTVQDIGVMAEDFCAAKHQQPYREDRSTLLFYFKYFLFLNNAYSNIVIKKKQKIIGYESIDEAAQNNDWDYRKIYDEYFFEYTGDFKTEDLELSRDFVYPKLTWGVDNENEFKTYYDFRQHSLYPYVKPEIIAKIPNPYVSPFRYPIAYTQIPNFVTGWVENKKVTLNTEMLNSCYIISDDNRKIFEIRLFPIDIQFSIDIQIDERILYPKYRPPDGFWYYADIPEIGFVSDVPSRVFFTRKPWFWLTEGQKRDETYKYVNSLACMEYTLKRPGINRSIEPFFFQGGTLPVALKWQNDSLIETKNLPDSIFKNPVKTTFLNEQGSNFELEFEKQIKQNSGNFNQLPNTTNQSVYQPDFIIAPKTYLDV